MAPNVLMIVDVNRREVYDRSCDVRELEPWKRGSLTVRTFLRAASRAGLALLMSGVAIGPLRADTLNEGLWSRLRRIESAFRSGDAGSLRVSFSSSAKVRVDLKDVAEGSGSYSPGQLQVMFGQIFDQGPTREFGFRPDDVTTASDTAFARGRWVRRQPSGRERTDTLTFTLHAESGDWRILEIRSSR